MYIRFIPFKISVVKPKTAGGHTGHLRVRPSPGIPTDTHILKRDFDFNKAI